MRAVDLDEKKLEALLLYAGRVITRADAARALDVSERQVNRLLRTVRIDRSVSTSRTARTEAQKRRLAREQAAQAVLEGRITEKQAAARAGCSERTIYRYLEKLK